MFGENLKTLRKQKGYSQEELATRLHVVRQTISKWEKNLSVPDADTLIRIAEIFDVSVSELLGTNIEDDKSIGEVAQQLSRINEQLAIKNRRAHRIWKTIGIVLAVIVAIYIVIIIVSVVAFRYCSVTGVEPVKENIEVIEENDSQTVSDYDDKEMVQQMMDIVGCSAKSAASMLNMIEEYTETSIASIEQVECDYTIILKVTDESGNIYYAHKGQSYVISSIYKDKDNDNDKRIFHMIE